MFLTCTNKLVWKFKALQYIYIYWQYVFLFQSKICKILHDKLTNDNGFWFQSFHVDIPSFSLTSTFYKSLLVESLGFISTFHLVSFPSMIFWAMKVRSMHSCIWLHLQWPKLKVTLFLHRSKVHHSWNIYKYLVNNIQSHEKIQHYMQFNTQSLKLNIPFLSILKMLVWHLWSNKPISIFYKLCVFWQCQCQLYVHYEWKKMA